MRRRRPRASWVLLALSVVLGLTATAVLQDHLERLEARARAGGDTVSVAVAARRLLRGARLTPEDLGTGRLPAGYLPPGVVQASEALGKTLLSDLAPGEVITATRLASGGPVAALVPAGLRAVSLSVPLPPRSLVSGDRVDVLATLLEGPPRAETVARDLEVLEVRPGNELDGTAATVVFLSVAPETAERIAYARTVAEVSVAIVGA